MNRLFLLPLAGLCGTVQAGELGAATVAKFVRLVLLGAAQKSVDCPDKEVAGELANLGVAVAGDSRVAWADNKGEVARLAQASKLVICGTRTLLADGAALAVVAEGGHPALYMNPKALAKSGISLPDSISKIAKVAQ